MALFLTSPCDASRDWIMVGGRGIGPRASFLSGMRSTIELSAQWSRDIEKADPMNYPPGLWEIILQHAYNWACMRKFLTRRNVVIGAIVLAVIGIWWWRGRAAKRLAAEQVKVVAVERKDVVETLTVSGKVEAKKKAILNFPVPGKLGFVRVSEGDEVQKGAWLMGEDLADLQAAQTRAYYSYLAADANAKQVEDEVKGHDSDETYEQKNDRVGAQTARDSAYEAWLVTQRGVANSILKAPFAGIVTGLTTEVVGDTVGVTDGATVVDPASLYFEVEIDESDVGKTFTGEEVKLKLDAFEGREFSGSLTEIGFVSRVSSTGATVYPAKVMFENDEETKRLRLGMNGDAEIIMGKTGAVLTVPVEAVVDGKVEREGGEKINVEMGLASDTDVEIKSGLNEGDKVVI